MMDLVKSPYPTSPPLMAALAALLSLYAAGSGQAQQAPANEFSSEEIEFFEKKVRPILVARCLECHSQEESNGGLSLDSREAILEGGDSGPAVVVKQPTMSLLVEAIEYENRDLQMPPKNRLPDGEIEVLRRWVEMGLPDPRRVEATGVKPTGMSIAEGREFWAFQPISDPAVPSVMDPAWVKTPIDAFLLRKLEQHELRPAPATDRRSWLRRVTFDLTGLPPTPAEITAFLADSTPSAKAKVVDRLLQSPHYGDRWGRHWLDVARYADSNGLDENLAFGNAWRYRDYVVDAFNRDLPYDQFVIQQLAGDLLPNADLQTRTATGFLVLGAKVLAEPDREKLLMDTIDEQLDTVGKTFMAMTMGCVRCHDHKFDPLKQTDYYAMAAIFKSTQTFGSTNTGAIKHWNEFEFADEKQRAELAKVDAEIARLNGLATSYKNKAIAELRSKVHSQAAEYLAAATQFAPDASLTEVEQIAQGADLHPRVLHHCRLHLEFNRDQPFFAKWHELVKKNDSAEAVREHYGALFRELDAALAAKKMEDPKATSVEDPRLETARKERSDASGFLTIPAKPEFALDEATIAEYHRLLDDARIYESNAPDTPAVMSVVDGEIHHQLPIHIRGSHLNLGEPVAREFPQVMRTSDVRPILPDDSSGRLELARWLASSQHPLTARVYVNRVWTWHFGTGLVASTENFGALGDRPSHPELLDWLARHFIKSGWSTKELHRLILLSSAYEMSVTHPDAPVAERIDADNRLLWHFPLQRLDAEQIRDSILAVSGRLDLQLGGKTVPLRNRQFVFNHTSVDHTKYDSVRRALYLPVIRNNLYTFFSQFDFPDPTMPTGRRSATVVAPQALLMMNSTLVMDSARAFADRVLAASHDNRQRIRHGYLLALGREPTEPETARALDFVAEATAHGRTNAADVNEAVERQAWALFCQALFASNEFIYLK